MAFGDRTLTRSPNRGPSTGSVVPLLFTLGGPAGTVDATHTVSCRAPFDCRIQGVTAATSAANTGSPTYDVTTTTGALFTGRAVPSNTSEFVDITAVATANRNVAKGELISVVFTDVGGSTVATGLTVCIALWVKDYPQTDEAND